MQPLTYETFRASVSEFLGTSPEAIERATHLYNDLGMDSLGMFSLGMHLIRHFGITLPLSEVPTIATIGDLFDGFERHRPTP